MTNVNVNVTVDMKMKEIQTIAKTVGVKFRPGMTKLDLIAAINAATQNEVQELEVVALEEIEQTVEETETVIEMEEVVAIEEEVITEESTELHWYEFLYRGKSPGAQPKNFVDSDDNYGKFGAVAYSAPLTEEEVESFELKSMKAPAVAEPAAPVAAPAAAPAVEEVVTDKTVYKYFSICKGATEPQIALMNKMLDALKAEAEKFDDIPYVKLFIETKSTDEYVSLKLFNCFPEVHPFVDVLNQYGFELNRKHFQGKFALQAEMKMGA